jgi:hypothetical protein
MFEVLEHLQTNLPFSAISHIYMPDGLLVVRGRCDPVTSVDGLVSNVDGVLQVIAGIDVSGRIAPHVDGMVEHEGHHGIAYCGDDRALAVNWGIDLLPEQIVRAFSIGLEPLDFLTPRDAAVMHLAPPDGTYGPGSSDIRKALKLDGPWATLELTERGYTFRQDTHNQLVVGLPYPNMSGATSFVIVPLVGM